MSLSNLLTDNRRQLYQDAQGNWQVYGNTNTDVPTAAPVAGDRIFTDDGQGGRTQSFAPGTIQQPSDPRNWDRNQAVPDYFNTPSNWDTKMLGPFWGYQDNTSAYKTNQSKIPNINDFIARQNISYMGSGYQGASQGYGRTWNADPEMRNQKAFIDQQYQNAVNDYNQQYGTNIQADQSVLGPNAANTPQQTAFTDKFGWAAPNYMNGELATALGGIGLVAGAGGLYGAFGPAAGGGGGVLEELGGVGSADLAADSPWALEGAGVGNTVLAPGEVAGAVGGGLDQIGSDWATGHATGATGGTLQQTAGGLTAANTQAGASPNLWNSLFGTGGPQTVSGPLGGTMPPGSGTALSRILQGNGSASTSDWLSVLGTAGSTLISALNDSQKSDLAKQLADQYAGYGAPSRARYEASMQPGFNATSIPGYQSALDTSWETGLRKASASGGNPVNNPGVMSSINNYVVGSTGLPAIQNYQNQNAATGGYNAFSTAAPAAAQSAISNSGNYLSDLTGGLSQLLNPKQNTQSDLASILNSFKGYYSGT